MSSAFENIQAFLDSKKSFLLEAGAGSGKTYTLIQSINDILEKRGAQMRFLHQKIVCITYTNVAKNEIIERLENNELVMVLTIHEFLWAEIKNYQKQLIAELCLLNDEMAGEKPEKYETGLLTRNPALIVSYDDSSFRDFENGQLHHDDVIVLGRRMFEKHPLLSRILAEKFPVLLVDEYQDTSEDTVVAFIDHLLAQNIGNFILGFYGDSHQKIYETGIGSLDSFVASDKLAMVTKGENYRSSVAVVALLNAVRSNIVQYVPEDKKDIVQGSVKFINCTNYPERGRTGVREYENQIMPQKNVNYDNVVKSLVANGWNFDEGSPDRILIIANSRVAQRSGFGELYRIYSNRYSDGATEALMKRENIFTKFFLGSMDKKISKERKSGIEHLLMYWRKRDYGSIMHFLNSYSRSRWEIEQGTSEYFFLRDHRDKARIADTLKQLEELARTASTKEVFGFCIENKLVFLPDAINRFIRRISEGPSEETAVEDIERIQRDKAFYEGIMALPYAQYANVFKHTQDQTVFSTKHGTKGDEFRNVLVVIDDTSWKQMYNFGNYFAGSDTSEARLSRTKNLFYVSCSRARENLVVLALSTMDDTAMATVNSWFKPENVSIINNI
ncbi:MAG: UvrD-helicase domain-containing protein [Pedobacter sp.]|nr:UvrD-helicase domain-containing protein [Pedobacter sp.]